MLEHDIIICQNSTRNLGCDGTSGWIWLSAHKLEDFLIESYAGSGLRGLRILELGSGTGWLSLRLALLGCKVTATDRQGAMLCLTRNIATNQERLHDAGLDIEVDIQQLDWDTDRIEGEWDLVTGSDIVYHQEHHRSLLETCIRHDGKRCIFAWEERIPTEEKSFIALAKELGFRVDSLIRADYNPETLNVIWVVTLSYSGRSEGRF